MLGGIESLLSAVIADGMAGTRHDPDAELLARCRGQLLRYAATFVVVTVVGLAICAAFPVRLRGP